MLTHLLSLVNSIKDYITLTEICQVFFPAICRHRFRIGSRSDNKKLCPRVETYNRFGAAEVR